MSVAIVRPERRLDESSEKSRSWVRFEERYPSVAAAYDELSTACRGAGPLDDQTVALCKLAISVGAAIDRTVHVHAKKALRAGVAPEALRQVALAAMPTIGLPRALDALRWIEESIEETLIRRDGTTSARSRHATGAANSSSTAPISVHPQ
jgi:alkylhydroperoxidase/carboxymuconolactone decarboxylase family protein YurZ